MSFSVNNTHLHLTNVNTVEEKGITPPPVTMILSLQGCLRKCVVYVHLHLHVYVCVRCVRMCVFSGE